VKRVLFYIEVDNISAVYKKVILKKALANVNVSLEILVNPSGKIIYSKDKITNDDIRKEIIFAYPKIENLRSYDLILTNNALNKLNTSYRKILADFSRSNNIKLLCIKDTACLDFYYYDEELVTIPTENWPKYVKLYEDIRAKTKKIFYSRPLQVYDVKPWFSKSREEFLEKYGLNPNKKLILFLPDGEHGHPSDHISHRLYQNIGNMFPSDYQVIVKLHPNEYTGYRRYFNVPSNVYFGLKAISHQDAYDAIHYCDTAIGSMTTMALEFSLYKKPFINVDFFPGQRNYELTKKIIPDLDYLMKQKLFFVGKSVAFDDLTSELSNILNQDYSSAYEQHVNFWWGKEDSVPRLASIIKDILFDTEAFQEIVPL